MIEPLSVAPGSISSSSGKKSAGEDSDKKAGVFQFKSCQAFCTFGTNKKLKVLPQRLEGLETRQHVGVIDESHGVELQSRRLIVGRLAPLCNTQGPCFLPRQKAHWAGSPRCRAETEHRDSRLRHPNAPDGNGARAALKQSASSNFRSFVWSNRERVVDSTSVPLRFLITGALPNFHDLPHPPSLPVAHP